MNLTPTTIYGFDNGTLTIDAAVSEKHDVEVTVTKHPIEYGANVTDHTIIEPRIFSLKGRVSSSPLHTYSGDILEGSTNRPSDAWDALENLMFSRTSISIQTVLKKYENVILKSLHAEQDWQSSQVLDFDAVFQEIFIVGLPETVTGESTTAKVVPDDVDYGEEFRYAQWVQQVNGGQREAPAYYGMTQDEILESTR